MTNTVTTKAKTRTIRLYQVDSSSKCDSSTVGEFSFFFSQLENEVFSNKCLDLYSSGEGYQFGNFYKNEKNNEYIYQGVIQKFRPDQLSSGKRNTTIEKIVELDPDHELIEKNHFVIFKHENKEYIAFECSMSAASIHAMLKLMNHLDNQNNYNYSDVMTTGSVNALLSGKTIKAIEFRISKPSLRSYRPDPNNTITRSSLEFMNSQNATIFDGKISTRSPTKGLASSLKDELKYLVADITTKKVKVRISELEDPIDLFGDRIKTKISFNTINGKITSEIILNAIRSKLPSLIAKIP